ncbi:hypothetical protein H0H93_002334, partial [Arthromyces matolae]
MSKTNNTTKKADHGPKGLVRNGNDSQPGPNPDDPGVTTPTPKTGTRGFIDLNQVNAPKRKKTAVAIEEPTDEDSMFSPTANFMLKPATWLYGTSRTTSSNENLSVRSGTRARSMSTSAVIESEIDRTEKRPDQTDLVTEAREAVRASNEN